MKRLPLGIQEFSEFHHGDYLYVDKTEIIHRLVTGGKYYFFSRPRRFGKSLLVNTLKELYRGKREYFEGLWIEDHWDWSQVYPVVQIDFTMMGDLRSDLEGRIRDWLQRLYEEHGLTWKAGDNGQRFGELLTTLYQQSGQKVVVLIDEYDKPILDLLDDLPRLKEQRQILKSFYGVLKGSDAHLELVFITGVSKFSQVSIFSGLNNLTDLTTDAAASQLVGISQAELERDFAPYLAEAATQLKLSQDELLAKIRDWYNGYSWDGQTTLYNPYSLLSFFRSKTFRNFWFSTGTPTFLTRLLKNSFTYQLHNLEMTEMNLATLNVERPNLASLLFQTGYLTIRDYDEVIRSYQLDYPNLEVKESLTQWLLAEYMDTNPDDASVSVNSIYRALKQADFEQLRHIFNAIFSRIPPHDFIENRERYFHSIIYLTFTLLGFYISVEVPSGRGRLDAVVKLGDSIFIFEFKLDESPEAALAQIKERGYAQNYVAEGKTIYLLGVNLISEKKEIEPLAVEEG